MRHPKTHWRAGTLAYCGEYLHKVKIVPNNEYARCIGCHQMRYEGRFNKYNNRAFDRRQYA